MQCVFALVVANALVAAAAVNVNYCGAKMCGHTNDHTFCMYPPGPSPRCRGYMAAPLSGEEKARIVARLNRRRSEAASGRLKHLTTAGNMLKLRWVEELAREAQRWADQCRPSRAPEERDACRDLFSTSVGQCVASVVGEAPGLRVESMVDLWYMQKMLYKGNVTHYVAPLDSTSHYGDFAQMIWARSYMVGCGRSRFMSEVNGRMRSVERLVCNIAPRGPQPFNALWVPAVPTSVCPPRSVPDPELPAMCNYQRNLDASDDVDGAMSLEEHVLLSIVLEIEDVENMLNYLGSLDELYMTKLAVVTMDNPVTTMAYNSVQKRDIKDMLGLDEQIVHIDNVLIDNDIHELVNATKIVMKIEKTKSEPRKKLNLIGRPKSYNIEDLGNVDGDQNLQDLNHHDVLQHLDKPSVDRDIYFDYSFIDNGEGNGSSVFEFSNTTNENNSTVNMTSFKSNDLYENTPSLDTIEAMKYQLMNNSHQIILSTKTESTDDYFTNITTRMNTTIDVTSRSAEDYLTDPETVRELQEALDRMERSISETQPPEKMRRERKGRSLDDIQLDVPNKENLQNHNQNEKNEENNNNVDQDGNKTQDKSPMLNMVMKYLPYLKPYQKDILGTVSSAGSGITNSYFVYSIGAIVNVLKLV